MGYNLDFPGNRVVSLEQPHNDVHLAVGGYDIQAGPPPHEAGILRGANGDMGENNTAAFDPIFFFHHCNVDRMFWLWQKRHCKEHELEIKEGYAGTSSYDLQGPVPEMKPGQDLTMSTPLRPFLKDAWGTFYTSADVVNIHSLGYDYTPGSLEAKVMSPTLRNAVPNVLTVRGINRAWFEGSFVVQAYAVIEVEDGGTSRKQTTERYLGSHAVLSRFRLDHCANCQTHLEVIGHFPITGISEAQLAQAKFFVQFVHHGETLPSHVTCKCTVNGVPAHILSDWRSRQPQASQLPNLLPPSQPCKCTGKRVSRAIDAEEVEELQLNLSDGPVQTQQCCIVS